MSNNTSWSAATTCDEVCRRAGGRNHYNTWRSFVASRRRQQVATLLFREDFILQRGYQSKIARRLGVSRATICRDVKVVFAEVSDAGVCPLCGKRSMVDLGKLLAAMPYLLAPIPTGRALSLRVNAQKRHYRQS